MLVTVIAVSVAVTVAVITTLLVAILAVVRRPDSWQLESTLNI